MGQQYSGMQRSAKNYYYGRGVWFEYAIRLIRSNIPDDLKWRFLSRLRRDEAYKIILFLIQENNIDLSETSDEAQDSDQSSNSSNSSSLSNPSNSSNSSNSPQGTSISSNYKNDMFAIKCVKDMIIDSIMKGRFWTLNKKVMIRPCNSIQQAPFHYYWVIFGGVGDIYAAPYELATYSAKLAASSSMKWFMIFQKSECASAYLTTRGVLSEVYYQALPGDPPRFSQNLIPQEPQPQNPGGDAGVPSLQDLLLNLHRKGSFG